MLYWEGSSKKDFKEFPIDVRKDMGEVLHAFEKKPRSGIATLHPIWN